MNYATTTEDMQTSASAHLKSLLRSGWFREKVTPPRRVVPGIRPGSVSKSLITDLDEEREIK